MMIGKKVLVLLVLGAGVFFGLGLLLVAARPGRAAPPPVPMSAFPPGAVPGQFMAKLHTEALGRLPAPARWQEWVDYFLESGCSSYTLREKVWEVYTSTEFITLYPDATRPADRHARLLALYRGALNREPDRTGFDALLITWTQTLSWTQVVSDFLHLYDAEFRVLTGRICMTSYGPLVYRPHYVVSSYHWNGDYPPLTMTVTMPPSSTGVFCGAACDQDYGDLQQMLYDAASTATKTVYLTPTAVVWVSDTLFVPAGVTLTTWSDPGPAQYALMGRLLRAKRFSQFAPGAVVEVGIGGTLRGVWVDGQTARVGRQEHDINVSLFDDGTANRATQLVNCRLSDSAGWTLVKPPGRNDFIEGGERATCREVYIGGNLLTGYANYHYAISVTEQFLEQYPNPWADGISISCEHTVVENNQVVDATDVGIVVFHGGQENSQDVAQASVISHNVVLNAGNSAFGGIGADARFAEWYQPTRTYSFSGTQFVNNALWTSPVAHMDIPLCVGALAWWSSGRYNMGSGAAFIGNTTLSQTVRANVPIAVSGMTLSVVCSNTLNVEIIHTVRCPTPTQELVLASESAGWASFAANPRCPAPQAHEDVTVGACIGHRHFPIYLPVVFKSLTGGEGLGEGPVPPPLRPGYPPPTPPGYKPGPSEPGYPAPPKP